MPNENYPLPDNSDYEKWTDEQLMVFYSQCNIEGFNHLFYRHKHLMYRYILKRVNDRDLADRIYSDTFLKIARKKTEYDPKYTFSTWTYIWAKRECLNEIDRRNRSPISFSEVDDEDDVLRDLNDPDPLIDEILAKQELIARIDRTLEDFDLKVREIVRRRCNGELIKDIAADIGLSANNCTQIFKRTMERIKRSLRK